ncbi:TIGR03752 family integrating conjugative element protein [Glaesserella parasuis]|uniref:TIGR03752 family integrating conjugative element protein n=1 Tax=Glaesserella parasuis TaxID=738 RepID=UPI003CE9BA0D
MSTVKSNGLLKIIVPIVVFAFAFILFVTYKNNQNNQVSQNEASDVVYDLTETEQKELGLTAGDTPHDTLKTLLGAVKETKAEVQRTNEENERLKKENQALKIQSYDVSRQIDDAIQTKQQELMADFERRFREVTDRFSNLSNDTPSSNDIPIGLGMEGESQFNSSHSNTGNAYPDEGSQSAVKWIKPSDVTLTDRNGKPVSSNFTGETVATFPNPFKALDDSTLGQAAVELHGQPNSREKQTKKPFYTLPANSTLMGSVAMTALLGRVPIDGNVTDPYPFKVVIGRENLMANGIQLPDVEGAIVSGTASGDWTLSCVKGNVDSITFVFSDGRIATQENQGSNNGKSLGWLSNPNGLPCIPGERKTNAPEYLSSQFLLSAAGATAQSMAQSQTTTVVDGNSVVGAVTGSQGKYILGQALGGGLKEMENWFRQRYGQMFDAIYVPPGQAVAVHISQSINIDYDSAARKVKYQKNSGTSQID